jgi:hypothetical protein
LYLNAYTYSVYGVINPDGSVASGTGDFDARYDRPGGFYEIELWDTYSPSRFSTVVTPIGSEFRTATTGTANGNLAVKVFDATGNAVQENFSFVVFTAEE